MWKSQKSSQRTFFIQSSDSKLKLPLKSKRRNTGSDHKLLNKLKRWKDTNWMSLSHQWEKKHHHWRKTVFSLLSGFGNSLVQHCGTVASYEAGTSIKRHSALILGLWCVLELRIWQIHKSDWRAEM